MSQYYRHLEKSLKEILADIVEGSSSAKWDQVQEFIEVGEYGLALESLVDTVLDEEIPLPRSVFENIANLADTMGIRASVVTRELEDRLV